jgi:hypothetical protein
VYCPFQRFSDMCLVNLCSDCPSYVKINGSQSVKTGVEMYKKIKLYPLTDLSPDSMYLTSCEMKQLSCRKFSLLKLGGSSSASTHFNSQSNVPPKYWSTSDLQPQSEILFFCLHKDTHHLDRLHSIK